MPEWLAAADNLDAVRSLAQALPLANGCALRALLHLCHAIAANSAVNEMDAQALAEVLLPVLAWRPVQPVHAPAAGTVAPGGAGTGLFTRMLSIGRTAGPGTVAGAGIDAAAEEASRGEVSTGPVGTGDVRVAALDAGEAAALVAVVQHLIQRFPEVYG